MALKKFGSPEQIHTITTSLTFDTNLAVKKIKDAFQGKDITIDQIHESLKALGITNYSSEDMDEVVRLLRSSGVVVK